MGKTLIMVAVSCCGGLRVLLLAAFVIAGGLAPAKAQDDPFATAEKLARVSEMMLPLGDARFGRCGSSSARRLGETLAADQRLRIIIIRESLTKARAGDRRAMSALTDAVLTLNSNNSRMADLLAQCP